MDYGALQRPDGGELGLLPLPDNGCKARSGRGVVVLTSVCEEISTGSAHLLAMSIFDFTM